MAVSGKEPKGATPSWEDSCSSIRWYGQAAVRAVGCVQPLRDNEEKILLSGRLWRVLKPPRIIGVVSGYHRGNISDIVVRCNRKK